MDSSSLSAAKSSGSLILPRSESLSLDKPATVSLKLATRLIASSCCRWMMGEFDVVGSCNGLLCLADLLFREPLSMYNPFTGDYRELPRLRQYADQTVVYGFGFHPATQEYKVTKIASYPNPSRAGAGAGAGAR
ncbi:hypothetical protein BT93_L3076 [Corymbia citriodora subsp. variegata]|uniref:Uncharacterized protein n=1 Tax=Corymbia citriodora subsp. variegata TaxID=360336 RepID=A0A8T0CJE2_CORYI|nr:hypothetical protein BT93_L3076 [Corymbia citriodora subsp. variegata]